MVGRGRPGREPRWPAVGVRSPTLNHSRQVPWIRTRTSMYLYTAHLGQRVLGHIVLRLLLVLILLHLLQKGGDINRAVLAHGRRGSRCWMASDESAAGCRPALPATPGHCESVGQSIQHSTLASSPPWRWPPPAPPPQTWRRRGGSRPATQTCTEMGVESAGLCEGTARPWGPPNWHAGLERMQAAPGQGGTKRKQGTAQQGASRSLDHGGGGGGHGLEASHVVKLVLHSSKRKGRAVGRQPATAQPHKPGTRSQHASWTGARQAVSRPPSWGCG